MRSQRPATSKLISGQDSMKRGFLSNPIVIFGHTVDKAVFTHVVAIGLPTILYYFILLNGWDLLALHLLIPTGYLVSSLIIIAEALVAGFWYTPLHRRQWLRARSGRVAQLARQPLAVGSPGRPQKEPSIPRCTYIVAAYLPNEQEIILETLRHLLTRVERPQGGLEVILAYNTPTCLPVEADLQKLAAQYPELQVLKVEGSHSKAENLNAALPIVTGEMTCILDADHQPAADSIRRAWRWLEGGRYDVVQGRNVIRNYNHNLLTKLVAVEFECLYGVSHPAKSLIADTAVFGGSNGYWRTSALCNIRFNPGMLTEDIDANLRTLLKGYRLVHDRSIIATELAPVSVRSLCSQRKRWDQGWLEISLKYQWPILRSDQFNLLQKLYWTSLLVYSKIFSVLSIQVYPVILALVLSHTVAPASIQAYVWFTTGVTFLSGPLQTLAAWKARDSTLKLPTAHFILHGLLITPYSAFKNIISIVAIYDHLLRRTEWVVTPRNLISLR